MVLDEVAAAEGKPLAWAGAPAVGGPAVLVGCWPRTIVGLRGLVRLADAAVVALCARRDVDLEVCPGGRDELGIQRSYPRRRASVSVRLVEARTGRLLKTRQFTGAEPPACAAALREGVTVADAPASDVSVVDVEGWIVAEAP